MEWKKKTISNWKFKEFKDGSLGVTIRSRNPEETLKTFDFLSRNFDFWIGLSREKQIRIEEIMKRRRSD